MDTCFSGYQMSVLVGVAQMNKFEQLPRHGQQMSLVVSYSEVQCTEEGQWVGGVPAHEVQCIVGNDRMRTPCRHTHTHTNENITFL